MLLPAILCLHVDSILHERFSLTPLHSEPPKLYGVLAVLSVIGLKQIKLFSWLILDIYYFQIVFIVMCSQYEPPTYDSYTYPSVAKVFGNILAMIPLLPLPVSMIYEIWRAEGTLSQVLFVVYHIYSVIRRGFPWSKMNTSNWINPMKFHYNTKFTLPKQFQRSRSIL